MPSSKILDVRAMEILDSRGNPTIETMVLTEYGRFSASVPSGASTGEHEKHELRDNDPQRYHGKGVTKAVRNVNEIIGPEIIGMDSTEQSYIDEKLRGLDPSKDMSNLGANALLSVSLPSAKAGAGAKSMPLYQHIGDLAGNTNFILPVPAFNVINGGAHAGNNLDIQEYFILPAGAKSFREALRIGSEVYHTLKVIIAKEYGRAATGVGDEGGFAPPLNDNKEPLTLIYKAADMCGHNDVVALGLDVAASEFFGKKPYEKEPKDPDDRTYHLGKEKLQPSAMLNWYKNLVSIFPIITIEDPFEQNAYSDYAALTKAIGNQVQIVGDDLFVTNPERLKKGIAEGAANALLYKANQIGLLTDSIEAWRMAKDASYQTMVSHRSGETEDIWLAHIVVGLGTGQIKAGGLSRGERLAKYNELLRIEQELGDKAIYAGKSVFPAGNPFMQ